MSLVVAEKLRKSAERRQRKRPLIRAFFNKLIHPTKQLMVYTPANFANPYQTLFYSGFKKPWSPRQQPISFYVTKSLV